MLILNCIAYIEFEEWQKLLFSIQFGGVKGIALKYVRVDAYTCMKWKNYQNTYKRQSLPDNNASKCDYYFYSLTMPDTRLDGQAIDNGPLEFLVICCLVYEMSVVP